jgi:P22 coat protein - gene protein 5
MPANTLGTLSPTVVSLKVLQFLKKKFPMLTAVATDFSEEAVLLNQQVTSRVVVPPPVSDYQSPAAGGTGYAAGAASTTDVPVIINKHKFVSLSFSDTEIASTRRNLVEEQIAASAYALGRQAALDLFALVTPAAFPNPTSVTAAANVSRNTILAVRAALNTQGATEENRFGVINTPTMEFLGADQTIVSRFFYNTEPDFKGGHIEGLAGFDDIFEYTELNPANNLLGFFGAKEALVFAARVPADPTELIPGGLPLPGKIENVLDPDSGLSLQMRYWYDFEAGALNMVLTWMYGVALGVAGHGTLLVHA